MSLLVRWHLPTTRVSRRTRAAGSYGSAGSPCLMTPPPHAGRLITQHVGTGNVVAAVCLGSGAAVSAAATVAARPAVAASSYLAASVAGYCLRRGCLHRLPTEGGGGQLGAAEVLRRHLAYEADWHLPDGSPRLGRLLHLLHVACWLLLFQPMYPVLELALFPLDAAAFWFYYPKARGCGLVIDSRELRREGKRGSRAQIFRLDWHRCVPPAACIRSARYTLLLHLRPFSRPPAPLTCLAAGLS